jgi:hypothetical protein
MEILSMVFIFFNIDFPICTAVQQQYLPSAYYMNGQYFVFWADRRFFAADSDSTYAIFGTRVTTSGTVIDPDGKMMIRNETGNLPSIASDGENLFFVVQDSC